MCHAVPAQVIAVKDNQMAEVELSGARLDVSVTLVGPVKVGEYLLVHVGFALGRIDPDEAAATLQALAALEEVHT